MIGLLLLALFVLVILVGAATDTFSDIGRRISVAISRWTRRDGDVGRGQAARRPGRGHDRRAAPRPLPTCNADEPSTFRFERAQLERVGAAESKLSRQALRRADEFGGEQATAILARAVQVLCDKLAHEPVAPAEQRAFLIALLDAIRAR